MKVTSYTHWFGVLLLFVSSILLLITSISAPIMNEVGLLRVTLKNGTQAHPSSVSFGTFGYCILNEPPNTSNQDYCTKRHIGYNPAEIMSRIDHTSFTTIAAGTSDGLTRVMVLHPVACALAFVAFLVSLGAGIIGSFVGALVALLAWFLTLISLAFDFSLFGIIRHHVNRDKSGSHAYFGSGIWMLLAAFVTLFLGMLIVFGTCCSAHREKKKKMNNESYPAAGAAAPPTRKKRFGIF